jgi:hypothetical protein
MRAKPDSIQPDWRRARRFSNAEVVGFTWSRHEWCRVQLLAIDGKADRGWVLRSELVFADAAGIELDGALDNQTEGPLRPVSWPVASGVHALKLGPRRRFLLVLPKGRLTVVGATCQFVALNAVARRQPRAIVVGGALAKRRNVVRVSANGHLAWPRMAAKLSPPRSHVGHSATLERLYFSLSGECRLGVMRFKGRGKELRAEKFELVFVRVRRISGRVRLGSHPTAIAGIRRGPVFGMGRQRTKGAAGLRDLEGCREYRVRTEAGAFSIIAEDCLLVPT